MLMSTALSIRLCYALPLWGAVTSLAICIQLFCDVIYVGPWLFVLPLDRCVHTCQSMQNVFINLCIIAIVPNYMSLSRLPNTYKVATSPIIGGFYWFLTLYIGVFLIKLQLNRIKNTSELEVVKRIWHHREHHNHYLIIDYSTDN